MVADVVGLAALPAAGLFAQATAWDLGGARRLSAVRGVLGAPLVWVHAQVLARPMAVAASAAAAASA